ncbi:MAG: LysM peptidoglycan-binding domain-containing protein [Pirellulales bacterium]|nr:LysM peptidoglycan-binding domain-containing protein [Pirellulales bacterium]HJN67306.1 LysM peptidoglycan-binding domain-containing protein [Pirellulales bacterium]
MNTLKTMVVLAILGIVGYGLYIGLNNGFQFQSGPMETPDWLTNEMDQNSEMGQTGPGIPQVGLGQVQGSPQQDSTKPSEGELPNPAGTGQIPVASYPPVVSPAPKSPKNPVEDKPLQPRPAPPEHVKLPIGGPKGSEAISSPGRPPVTANNQSTPKTGAQTANPTTPVRAVPPSPKLGNSGVVPPVASGPPAPSPVVSPPIQNPENGSNTAFEAALSSAKNQLQQGQMAIALLTLSIWYEDPRLQADQQERLTGLLDRIAGTVIYSQKHLIEPPHRVKAGETIVMIAKSYKISEGLLIKINQIQNAAAITPGQELKVVRGPFNATINSKKRELTLWLGGRYAGRFELNLGPEFEQIVGPFVVLDKTRSHASYQNQPWIRLGPGYGAGTGTVNTGPQLGIAGIANIAQAPALDQPGRIGVSTRDADDLHDILSRGSKVTIQR